MDKVIDIIIEKLNKYPEIKYSVNTGKLTITPVDSEGFPIQVERPNNKVIIVYFDYWHEEFKKEIDVLNCVGFGLSDQCRLKLTSRGLKPYKWTLQYLEDEEWKSDSTTGLFNIQFWKKKSITYLQNKVVTAKM